VEKAEAFIGSKMRFGYEGNQGPAVALGSRRSKLAGLKLGFCA
jgi:hypothetical protein